MNAFKIIQYFKPKFHHITCQRNFSFQHSIAEYNVLHQIDNRSLVRVRGDDAVMFLQGLITNDMRHLEEGAGSMFTMFLNTKGRVMYDSIIYNTEDKNSFLIECDTNVISIFQKHLKMYRIKKNVDIEILPEFNIWVLFNNTTKYDDILEKGDIISYTETVSEKIKPVETQPLSRLKNILIYNDPRLSLLGSRLVCPVTVTAKDIKEELCIPLVQDSSDRSVYQSYRYKLGVGEGVRDLPPGNCFPLEANCDYLHGVSFQKGCYIGQELTARTHHTGVVRKRLMPLLFESLAKEEFDKDTAIYSSNDSKTSIGKIRGKIDIVGLGLLRITQALESSLLLVSGRKAKTFRPAWWPKEVSKEKVSSVHS